MGWHVDALYLGKKWEIFGLGRNHHHVETDIDKSYA
jgi:hypothetical protein